MDRKQHWEQIYQNKDADAVSWFQPNPSFSLALIKNAGLKKSDPVIDVGGGASMLVDRLLEQGYQNLAVLDISKVALEVVQQRLGEKAVSIDWYVEDVTQFSPPCSFALWHDRAVFHFLTEAEDRRHYVAALSRVLVPDGQVIIAAFAIGGPKQCSELDIVQYDGKKLAAELGDGFRLLEQRSEAHITPANKTQEFNYFRFIKT